MFAGCTKLESVTLGENFSFKCKIYNPDYYAILPDPPEDAQHSGLWVRVGDPSSARTAADLRDEYDGSTMAGTWVWQGPVYTVRFAAPDGVGGSMRSQSFEPGETAALNPNTFYRFGWTFTGWDADGDGVVDYLDGADFTAGDAGERITLTALFEKEQHSAALQNGVLDLYLHGGEKATFTAIPAGTAYQVWEETPAGWVLLRQENTSGVIEPLQTAEATFLNRYQPGSASTQIIGTKTLDGRAAGEGAFSFQLLDGTRVLQTVTNLSGGFIRFDPITYTVDDVGEHVYTVREVRGTNSAVDYDTHTERVTVTVSGDIENLTATVSYDSDGVKFANRTRPGSIEITKHGEGVTDANSDTEFTFRVRLTNDSGMPLGDGESFNWYVKEEQSSPTTARSNPTGGTRTVSRQGNLSDTVEWILYNDGELVIQPKNGLTEGSFDGNRNSIVYFWPWYNSRLSITKVTVKDTCKLIGSAAYMFYSCSMLTAVDVSGWDTGNVTDMRNLFTHCYRLTAVDVSDWDTGNVTSMDGVFYNCHSLTALDVSGWDTGNVRSMISLFSSCNSLTSLDVSGWDTGNVTDMSYMFSSCSSLTTLDLSGWDTGNVTNMRDMFSSCSSLTTLDVSGWDTGKVRNMYVMFYKCEKLSEIKLGGNFSFIANISSGYHYGILPDPPVNSIFTGKWTQLESDGDLALTATDLRYNYDANAGEYAGTWVWQVRDNVYTVVYDANGGYTSATNAYPSADNPTLTLPDEDTTARPDHKLIGWNTKADGTGTAYGVGETVSDLAEYGSSITLYAQWEAGTPNVKYRALHYQQNTDFETYTLTETAVYRAEPGTEQTPEVKTYPGFKSPAAQTLTVLSDGSAVVEYYYDRTRYTVAFDANGGEGEMDPMDMVGGVGETLSANQFTKQDALFTGWNTAADGTGTAYSDGQTVNSIGADGETVTLYAQWYENPEEVTPSTDGEFTVTVKAGQTVVIPNLPAGTRYEIVEVDLPNGWTLTESSGETGTVASNHTSGVDITNTYEGKGDAAITAHKRLTGETLTSGAYTFQLLDSDRNVIETVTNGPIDTVEETTDDSGATARNPWYGTGPVIFDLFRFTQAGEYTYYIREVAGDDDTVVYDTHEETVTVTVTDNGDGTLNTEVAYDSDGALFENSMKTGSLTVSKTLHNATAAAEEQTFAFTLTLRDASGNPLTDAYTVRISDGTETTVTDGGTVRIRGGERFMVVDLPNGCVYEVTEQAASGFELTDSAGTSGVIQANRNADATFENTYFSSGSVTLAAGKTFEGGTLEEGKFLFQLSDSEGHPMETVSAKADGSVTFTPIDYTVADDGKTFVYYISEVAGDEQNITYDSHTETVTVSVSDDGHGNLTTTTDYSGGARFVNYQWYDLTVSKTVTGNIGDRTETFPFTIRLTRNGEPYTEEINAPENVSWTAGEAGEYTFTMKHGDEFTLTLLGGVVYEITETDPKDYDVTVAVTDSEGETLANAAAAPSAKGTLTGDQTAAFTNNRDSSVPTGLDTPMAEPAFLGIGVLAATGLILLLLKKRRKHSEA